MSKNRSCCYDRDVKDVKEEKKVNVKVKDRTCSICNCFSKINKEEEENRKNLEEYIRKVNIEIKENNLKINNPPGGINLE